MPCLPKVNLTRRVTFSSGHRYWSEGLSEQENKLLFGSSASAFNHGHNYILDVTVAGATNPITGMVVNIKKLDDLIRASVVKPFDLKSLNDEVPEFALNVPTLENLLEVIRQRLADGNNTLSFTTELGGTTTVDLIALRLEEMPTLWATWKSPKMPDQTLTLTRSFEFAAAHRLHLKGLSDEENLRLFGKCNNPTGHGHNYILEVTVTGDLNKETGMIVDLAQLDKIVNREIVDRYDHHFLNSDLSEFKNLPTTTEYVTLEIFKRLKSSLPFTLTSVKLYETARNAFEVRSDDF